VTFRGQKYSNLYKIYLKWTIRDEHKEIFSVLIFFGLNGLDKIHVSVKKR
jgi:hypothetical protein